MRINQISLLASVALVAVFVGTAALTLSSDRHQRQHRQDTRDAVATSALYKTASEQAQRGELLVVLSNWTADPQYLSRARTAQTSFRQSLAAMTHSPRSEDRTFGIWASLRFGAISDVFLLLDEDPAPAFEQVMQSYLVQYTAIYDSIRAGDIGDPALADQLTNPREVSSPLDLTTNPITVVMAAKAAERDLAAAAATADSTKTERVLAWAAPLRFGLSILVVVALVVVNLFFGRREARIAAENAQLRRLSTTDPLTELGNRRGFEEAAKRVVDAPPEVAVSLVMMDLDEFKLVNDTFGHARGDAVLKKFAELLSRLAPPGASRFRVGGDEFALIVHGLSVEGSMDLADAIRLSAQEALGSGVTVTAGVAMLDPKERDESLLRQMADAALYEGKLRGRNLTMLYLQEGNATPVFPAAKLHAVRQLLEEGRIDSVFQPIWDIHTQGLLGYEGLSRPHPDYGLNGPEEAFEIAERFGHAADLDRLCRSHLLEASQGLPPDSVLFLNVSPYSLTHHSFTTQGLLKEFEEAGIAVQRVVLEITEKSNIATEAVSEAVSLLRAGGLSIALDDVGSGNNGLEMLRKVPFDYLKIDRAVMVAAADGHTGRAALMAILAFASEYDAIVIAEGIEDAEMLATVRSVAGQTSLKGKPGLIQGVQGFLLGMPLPAAEIVREVPPRLAA